MENSSVPNQLHLFANTVIMSILMSTLNKLLFTSRFRVASMHIVQVSAISCSRMLPLFLTVVKQLSGALPPSSGLEREITHSISFRSCWLQTFKNRTTQTSHYFLLNKLVFLSLWNGTLRMCFCSWCFSKWKRTCSIVCFRKGCWIPPKNCSF